MKKIIAVLCLSAAVSSAVPAAAQTAAELYEQGVEARNEQRFEDAVAALERAAALEPENADTQVQLGFAQSALGNEAAARAAFTRALEIAPDYQDARFGLAQLDFRAGALQDARERAATVLQAQPSNREAVELLAAIEKAEAVDTSPEVPIGKWRLDVGSEVSDLSGGRSSWTDSFTSLSYQLTSETTLAGRARLASRSGRSDIQLEARIDHRPTADLAVHGLVAATPEADFLAELSLGGGASWRAIERTGSFGPLFVNADLRHDIYFASNVTTITPGLQYFLLDERLAVSARWVHSQDDTGTSADGYVLRGDIVASDRLRLFAGYADAPEISEGALVDTRSIFTGLSFDLNDGITLNASYAHEERDAFDRNTLGLGLSVRF